MEIPTCKAEFWPSFGKLLVWEPYNSASVETCPTSHASLKALSPSDIVMRETLPGSLLSHPYILTHMMSNVQTRSWGTGRKIASGQTWEGYLHSTCSIMTCILENRLSGDYHCRPDRSTAFCPARCGRLLCIVGPHVLIPFLLVFLRQDLQYC